MTTENQGRHTGPQSRRGRSPFLLFTRFCEVNGWDGLGWNATARMNVGFVGFVGVGG